MNYAVINGKKIELTDDQVAKLGLLEGVVIGVNELSEIVKGGDARKEFDIRDTIHVCGMSFKIIGFDHDRDRSITLMSSNLLPVLRTRCGESEERWSNSKIRQWLNEDIMNSMPADLVNHMEYANKLSYDYKGNESETADKIFLLSESELFGSGILTGREEGKRYDAFCNSGTRIMKSDDGSAKNYWTRSAVTGFKDSFVIIDKEGFSTCDWGYNNAFHVPICIVFS